MIDVSRTRFFADAATQRFLTAAGERLEQLSATASKTGKAKDRALEKLLQTTQALRPCYSVFDIVPVDVINYLLSLDKSAHTRVHVPECEREGDCDCPKRAHASAIKTHRLALSKACAEQGLLVDWSEQTKTGNPVQSRLVRDYEAAVNREQLVAGVGSKQAALFDYSVYATLQDTLLQATKTALAERNVRSAVELVMDAFLLAFMFCSGARLADSLTKDWRDVQVLALEDGVPHWRIRRGRTKTTQKVASDSYQELHNTNDRWHVIQVAAYVDVVVQQAGLGQRQGPLFRRVQAGPSAALSWGIPMTKAYAFARFEKLQMESQVCPKHTTLHSFHASAAVHLLQTRSPQEVITLMNWSERMLWRYLDQPVFTVGGTVKYTNAAAALLRAPARSEALKA